VLKTTRKFLLNDAWAISNLAWFGLLYLSLPVAIFLLAWEVTLVGLPLVTLLVTFLVVTHPRPLKLKFVSSANIVTAICAAIWVYSTGIFGHGFGMADDWVRMRFDLLSTLTQHSWPIRHVFEQQGDVYFLRHYLAYYLPGPLVGKFFGGSLQVTQIATGVWTFLGVWLVLLMVINTLSNLGKRRFIAIPIFVLFSGLDVIGSRLKGFLALRPSSIANGGHIEWWAREFQFSSNTTLIHWVPQHALSGWLATLILCHLAKSRAFIPVAIVLPAITLLWSPFSTAGIIIVICLLAASRTSVDNLKIYWKQYLPLLFGAITLFAVLALFLFSGTSDIQRYFIFSDSAYKYMGYTTRNGFILTLGNLGLFLLLEVGFYLGLCFYIASKRRVLISLGVALSAVLLLKVGLYNDFAMRASIPLLCILSLEVSRAVLSRHRATSGQFARVALTGLLMIGSVTAIFEFVTRARTQPAGLIAPCIDSGCLSDLTSDSLRSYNWTRARPILIREP